MVLDVDTSATHFHRRVIVIPSDGVRPIETVRQRRWAFACVFDSSSDTVGPTVGRRFNALCFSRLIYVPRCCFGRVFPVSVKAVLRVRVKNLIGPRVKEASVKPPRRPPNTAFSKGSFEVVCAGVNAKILKTTQRALCLFHVLVALMNFQEFSPPIQSHATFPRHVPSLSARPFPKYVVHPQGK